jgi:hypothetical protein
VAATELRQRKRIPFSRGYVARLVSLDGKWRLNCRIENISDSGARLELDDELPDDAQLFLLALSSTGRAHRRCQCVWKRDHQMGVSFIATR